MTIYIATVDDDGELSAVLFAASTNAVAKECVNQYHASFIRFIDEHAPPPLVWYDADEESTASYQEFTYTVTAMELVTTCP